MDTERLIDKIKKLNNHIISKQSKKSDTGITPVSINVMMEIDHWEEMRRFLLGCNEAGIMYDMMKIQGGFVEYNNKQIHLMEFGDEQIKAATYNDIYIFFFEEYDEPAEMNSNKLSIHNQNNFRNWFCEAGLKNFFINANGDVYKLNTKKTLAVQLTGVFSSYQLYLNGKKLLQNGVPGVTKETSIPQQLPLIKEFPADTILTFAWKISNFHSMNGGAPLSPVLGLSEAVRNFYWGMDVFYCIIIGIILFMSLYNFSLWIVRPKDIPSLYLALACFMIFIRMFTNKFFFSRIFHFTSIFELHFKLEYISSTLILVFSIYYFYSLFPEEFVIRKHRLNLIMPVHC